MPGMPWPDKFSAFKDIADKHYSDADESGLDSSAKGHGGDLTALQSALQDADDAYAELVGAFEVDGKQSDSYAAVRARQQEFRKQAGMLAAKALAGQRFMDAAVGPVKDSKSNDQVAANKALETIQSTQFWPDWMLHRAGKETHMEQARRQLEDDMSKNQATRVNALTGSYKPPADGEYGFDGQPTSWVNGPVSTKTDFNEVGSRNEPVSSKNTFQQVAERSQATSSQTGFQQVGERHEATTSGENYGQAGIRATDEPSPSGAQSSPAANQSQGASSGGSEGAGAPAGGGASTGLQSGAAVAEHAAPAASAMPSGAGSGGGGGGAPPSIGGIGGGPAGGGAGVTPRIGGVGGGAGGEVPRTGVQGSGVTEKPSASQSSSGSNERQGSGLSRGGGAGAGAAGAETRAQSAQQAALKDAVRTGDTAAGAGRAADRVAGHAEVLGTDRVTQLSVTALQSAHAQTGQLLSSLGGLTGSLAASHPAASAGELAGWIVNGGTVTGAGRAGFLADGITWGRVPQPPFEHVGLSGLVFLFEDFRVEPNEAAGVFRPVTARVTTTGWLGEVDPAMRLPEGTRILDRSQAPAGTDHITNAGLLARGLGRWLLEDGLDGDKSWRLIAVCFLEEPDTETVDGLLRLQHQVEAYWPGRLGYETNVPQEAVVDAKALGDEDLKAKRGDPLRHAQEAAKRDPNGLYDPAGLPPKEAEWYRDTCERQQKERLTNSLWRFDLDERYKKERRGDDDERGFRW